MLEIQPSEFEMRLVEEATNILADEKRRYDLCSHITDDVASLEGAHLSHDQISELNSKVIEQVRDVVRAVERALDLALPELASPEDVADSNTVLDSSISAAVDDDEDMESFVDAGLITRLREEFTGISQKMVKIFYKMKESASDYFFDLRLSAGGDEKAGTWLTDFEEAMKSMERMTRSISSYAALYTAHGAQEIFRDHENRMEYLGAENKLYESEFLARARVLSDDFKRIVAGKVPKMSLTKELAVHYFEVIHMMRNNLVRATLHFSDEREEPGLTFPRGEVGPKTQPIYRNYSERMSVFLDSFRLTIIAVNTMERALLFLECREAPLESSL